MSRTRAQALVLVNWKGVFYERYLIDRHVTALEGANGAGKTTVMIAAYVVLLPDMSRLRFTNLGETGATGGDKGIWGRLGESGRPAYCAMDFDIPTDGRLIAGVHLEKKGEPSVEPTPFVVSGLGADVRLQDVLLLSQGDEESVPELNELRENAARLGGRLQVFGTAREYFTALFNHGVTPLRLGTDEERGKLNEMLRTSMTGGISRALTSDLRSFLLKEESGLADTLQRMRANLDACRRTRTEVQESQRLEREIGGVFEAGQAMFTAAFLATRERADEMRRRVADAEEALRAAQHQHAKARDLLNRVHSKLESKRGREIALATEEKAAEDWLRRLKQAQSAARDVTRRRKELSSEQENARIAAEARKAREKVRTQCRDALRRREDDYNRAAAGLANLQRGVDELHRRAGAYRQVVRRKAEAERLLQIDELAVNAIADRIAEDQAELDCVDRSRRDAKRRVADADHHRREHAAALAALEHLADATIQPSDAHSMALQALRRFRDLKTFAKRRSTIAAELVEVRELANQQAAVREQAKRLGFSFPGQRLARIEVTEQLDQAENKREQSREKSRAAEAGVADCQRTLDSLLVLQKELTDRVPLWRDLATRAQRLVDALDRYVASLPALHAARKLLAQRIALARTTESELTENRDSLQSEARALLAAGGPFDPELLRLRDALGADLLAGAFEDADLEDAAVLEAKLGPLAQALAVDDASNAARQIHDRSESLSNVWLVNRDEDAALLGIGTPSPGKGSKDLIIAEQRAIRVTRIPTRPWLGRKAREQRAAELREEAEALDLQIETTRADRRQLERLARDGEELLESHAVWLAGDPAPELVAVGKQRSDIKEQQAVHHATASRYQEAASEIEPRVEALRSLLGAAALLDPPDQSLRRDDLEREHAKAVSARDEVKRCREAARVVEDNLDTLRQPPLTNTEVAELISEQMRLSEERDRLDSAIEAMEFVASNAEALDWDDAPAQLEEDRSLVPALDEQLRRAEHARTEAEVASATADSEYDTAKTLWHDANNHRSAIAAQLDAAEKRFTEMGIPDPSESTAAAARDKLTRLQKEAKALTVELDELKTAQGRYETKREQAERVCDEAKKKVVAERKEAVPAIERWERLRTTVTEHNLPTSELATGDSDIGIIRGHINLVQEAYKQKTALVERLRVARGGQEMLARFDTEAAHTDAKFADTHLEHWLAVRDWLRRRLPSQVAEVDDPLEALMRLRDQLAGLEARLARQEGDLRGASEDVARGIEVQIRKARGQVTRINHHLRGISFGSIEGIRVKVRRAERMERVLRALKKGAAQELLFQENMPIEDALAEVFRRYGGGRAGGQRLLDYREYIHLQVEVRRAAGPDWEVANPTRLSTGEAIGVGAALMMVVLTEWEQNANLLRGKRAHGSLRFLFLDEANRLSQDNLGVVFGLCRTLDLQLLIAAPEVARAEGNTTYRLVRRVNEEGREEVLVTGRRTRSVT